MIDWANLAANGLWILGCAVILATLSYASWDASVLRERMGARLGRASYQAGLSLGLLLFTIGLAAAADEVLPRIIWGVLAVLALLMLIRAAMQAKKEPKAPATPPDDQ